MALTEAEYKISVSDHKLHLIPGLDELAMGYVFCEDLVEICQSWTNWITPTHMSPLQQLSDAWKIYWICQWYSSSNGRGSTMFTQLGNRILIKHVATKYPMWFKTRTTFCPAVWWNSQNNVSFKKFNICINITKIYLIKQISKIYGVLNFAKGTLGVGYVTMLVHIEWFEKISDNHIVVILRINLCVRWIEYTGAQDISDDDGYEKVSNSDDSFS